MNKAIRICLLLVIVSGNWASIARADDVTEWNQIMLDTFIAGNVGGIGASRPGAIVQSAVYDAVNGIDQRYAPLYVKPAAAVGASRRAAAVQAAYATLVKLFPGQKDALDAKRAASLAANKDPNENAQSIERGVAWGQTVADAIWAWRSADGFAPAPPPNRGGNGMGQWRPTLPGEGAFAVPQLGKTTPWVIQSPTQFKFPGPPALSNAEYTRDFNEVKRVGARNSSSRTSDQTQSARFWASTNSPNYVWNRVAVSLATKRNFSLLENARMLAMVNVAIADAAIVVWNSKLTHLFWRPITAIRLADADDNPQTIADPQWESLVDTPPYPDYPSGLVGLSAAPAAVLSDIFGRNTAFTTDSNGLPGVTRAFPNFNASVDEIVEARIVSGIHFRFADEDAKKVGTAVGEYIIDRSFRPAKGTR